MRPILDMNNFLQCSTCAALSKWLNSEHQKGRLNDRQVIPCGSKSTSLWRHPLQIGTVDSAEPRDSGADVGHHRRAVPPAGRAARRGSGGFGNDRVRRHWLEASAKRACAARGRASASTSCSSPAARRIGWRKAPASPKAQGADIIDINMGCPSKQVTNGAAGSALMRDLDHALTLDRGDRRRRAGAGDAEDAARLGSRQHQRAGTRAPRGSRRRQADHRAWPHPLPVLRRQRRLVGGARGEAGGHRSRSSSMATFVRSTMPRARSPPPAPTR